MRHEFHQFTQLRSNGDRVLKFVMIRAIRVPVRAQFV